MAHKVAIKWDIQGLLVMLKEIFLMQLGSANRRKRHGYIFRCYGRCCGCLPQTLQAAKGNCNFSLVFPNCMGTHR